MNNKIKDIIEKIKQLSIGELSDLIQELKDLFGIKDLGVSSSTINEATPKPTEANNTKFDLIIKKLLDPLAFMRVAKLPPLSVPLTGLKIIQGELKDGPGFHKLKTGVKDELEKILETIKGTCEAEIVISS